MFETKEEILQVLRMPEEDFMREIAPLAYRTMVENHGGKIRVSAMLGHTNICRNRCLYCGMRAPHKIPRYRMNRADVIRAVDAAAGAGYHRIFLVGGEDPLYPFDDLCEMVRHFHENGMFVTLACGEFAPEQYRELKEAGADEYVMKFEMSHEDSFNRLNPSTNYKKRLGAIDAIRAAGLLVASGNIIDWPGQTEDELADDILLTKKLGVSWAPVIPYMPVAGTPLAEEGGPGSILKARKETALLRLMMPKINISAQQPGHNLKEGLTSRDGNIGAIRCGANYLFFDLLPLAKSQSFNVVDNRNMTGTAHLRAAEEETGLALDI